MPVLLEQIEGTRWIVVHSAEPAAGGLAFTLANAPPPYASPDLAAAMAGALETALEGHCGRCEAVALPPATVRDGDPLIRRWTVPHASWCPWSDETVDSLHEACRPPGPLPQLSAAELEAEAGRVRDYLNALSASLGAAGTAERGVPW